MSLLRNIAVGCFVLLVLSEFADGLRCYQCTGCDSPFNQANAQIVDRPNDQGYSCSKTTARNVGTIRDITQNCHQGDLLGIGQWCCNTDLCNGATPAVSSAYFAFIMVIAVAIILF